jgi:hypothetical protein
MPAVSLVPLADAAAVGVDVRWHRLALNASGYSAFFASDQGKPLIVILDSTGHLVGTAGATGSGPGEFHGPDRLWFFGDTLLSYETSRLTRIRFDLAGSFLDERRFQESGVAVGSAEGGVLEYDIGRSGTSIRFREYPGESTVEVLPPSDGRLQSATTYPGPGRSGFRPPIVTGTATNVFLLDPFKALLYRYDRHGRFLDSLDLSPYRSRRGPRELAEARASLTRIARDPSAGALTQAASDELHSLEDTSPPLASQHGLQVDGRGRVWILGPDQDSTQAIVISNGRVLGTLRIPCHDPDRFVAVSGAWLGALCERSDTAATPYGLQLYRIVERGDSTAGATPG